LQFRPPAREFNYRGHGCIYPSQCVVLTEMRIFSAFNRNKWRADAVAGGRVLEKCAANIQRVGRNQIVSTWIMRGVYRLGTTKDVVPFPGDHIGRAQPGPETRSFDVLNGSGYGKVIDLSR